MKEGDHKDDVHIECYLPEGVAFMNTIMNFRVS
jgi:hypothetical protein